MMDYKKACGENRYARIRVRYSDMVNHTNEVQAIMSKAVIFGARMLHASNCMEYEAASPLFDSIGIFKEPPIVVLRQVPKGLGTDGSFEFEFEATS